MLTKISCPAILALLALAPLGVGHAADLTIDCRLKGGTVVQLSAQACKMEGGVSVNTMDSAASGVIHKPEGGNSSGKKLTGNSTLAEIQEWIVDLLAVPVETSTPLNRNPEGIARTAKFDGCRLVVDEELHIQYGNFYSVWKDFKINSVIDLQNINLDQFGIVGKVTSKGGDLAGVAVYFEEPRKKNGNNISISVTNLKDGSYKKYTTHGPSAYWSTPRDDLWIADEYGYAKDDGRDNVATDKIRSFLIVNTSDDAARLKSALDEVSKKCKPQQGDTK